MIRMTKTVKGSPDGICVAEYQAGLCYDLTATKGECELAAVFLREGWAAVVPENPPVQSPAPILEAPQKPKRSRR